MHPLAGTPFAFWMTSMAFWTQMMGQAETLQRRTRAPR